MCKELTANCVLGFNLNLPNKCCILKPRFVCLFVYNNAQELDHYSHVILTLRGVNNIFNGKKET